jgi:hypothetical protein
MIVPRPKSASNQCPSADRLLTFVTDVKQADNAVRLGSRWQCRHALGQVGLDHWRRDDVGDELDRS